MHLVLIQTLLRIQYVVVCEDYQDTIKFTADYLLFCIALMYFVFTLFSSVYTVFVSVAAGIKCHSYAPCW